MSKKDSKTKELKEKLFYKKKNIYKLVNDDVVSKAYDFCDGYKAFLDSSKTEREAVKYALEKAKANGFREYKAGMKLKTGDKIFVNNRGKAVILAVIGKEPLENGAKICAAHIDSPRLDLKQCPLYEDNEIALFKTHYYGGIKKYQWTAIPLALHGVVVLEDGTTVEVNVGEDENDPVFVISDLLPHLASEQMKKPATQIITGEELNIIVGSRPFKEDEESELVKLNILSILNEKYGINEEDFLSAELEAVPAFKASDIGFDRSMIGSYGHDDRVCAYPALEAILNLSDTPDKTAVTVLTDKEETGSDGNTGLCSSYLKYFFDDIACDTEGSKTRGTVILSNSECLSADVNAAFDPTFPSVVEKKNTAYINYGVVVTKFTGSRGKSGTSDASAEFVGKIRTLLNKNEVVWQTGELGKVDGGGGGTVAAYIANLNVDTIDVGVPVLSMHAPYEVVSKMDVYMAYKAFEVFFCD
ncbi:MAG: aminopeptidase [Oscillospiraceae bacterium]|nr:aminopeptidase [Ruminococcus sp.]MBQ9981702.1 aminopeptidase [Oscillospiraceae bacterium]